MTWTVLTILCALVVLAAACSRLLDWMFGMDDPEDF